MVCRVDLMASKCALYRLRALCQMDRVEIAWDDVHEVFKAFLPAVAISTTPAETWQSIWVKTWKDTLGNLGSVHRRLSEACTN